MAEEEPEETLETIRPEFPTGRIKRIMKLDPDIAKVNSEALFLVSLSAQLFLGFLAEKSAAIAVAKKRRTVKLENIVSAVKNHTPTSDFLLDSLPAVDPPAIKDPTANRRDRPRAAASEKPVPAGTRRIDDFFKKPAVIEADES